MDAYETWAYSWKGKTFSHKGVKYVIEEQLSEEENIVLAQRLVLTVARQLNSGRQFLLKIKYDLDPEEFDIDDEDEHEELVANHAGHEVDLANFLYEIGHGPKLLDYYGYLQRENDPYKGGAMYFIAMEYVPGEDVDEIRDELTQDELLSIRRQLAYILNKMAMINRGFANEDPACLRYDREADKLYVVDLTHWMFQYLENETITENSAFVRAFNLWKDESFATAGTARVPRQSQQLYDPPHRRTQGEPSDVAPSRGNTRPPPGTLSRENIPPSSGSPSKESTSQLAANLFPRFYKTK